MAILFRPFFAPDLAHWCPALQRELKNHDLRLWPDAGNPDDIEYLVIWRLAKGDKAAWPKLKAVLSLSAGVNQYVGHPELPAVPLVRMIEPGMTQSMTEYVSGFVLRFHREHDRLKKIADGADWDWFLPILAQERRIGFLGAGVLAQAAMKALQPMGFDIRCWSRQPKKISGVKSFHGREGFAALLGESDILVNMLPLTKETENILNRESLSRLPRGACLINIARGQHIVDEDLLALLASGHIAMAALDVFRKEPLEDSHPFRNHPQIILTPHASAITYPQTGAVALRQAIESLEKGERPAGQVDFSRGY